ncbi:NAD-dependent epimerase/dehydratase family protein [Nocardia stercoris]|uniref:NAD-dependent epimerase/dehydratase family protein n=2 Tax=Nocardia stercoris TaxID=2483361 RepID=A0A3M2L9Z4_9NOCA|nr:NAD-dependent epimerase/dehydratase family protein [Nocardia stercoris]
MDLLATDRFDHLFGAADLRMLPQAALALVPGIAVTFQTHSATWALLDRARTHNVCWHVLTARADAGEVLAERTIEIADTETSRSLRAKCQRAGLESFTDLVGDLEAGRLRPIPRVPAEHGRRARSDRPPLALALRWTETAEDLDALVRATRFGAENNEFGTAKLVFDGAWLAVTGSGLGPLSTAAPGTVVALSDTGLTVATCTRDLVLTGLTTLTGEPVTRHELRVRTGMVLPTPSPREAAVATTAYRESVSHERYWVKRLSELRPLRLPAAGGRPGDRAPGARRRVLTAELMDRLPDGPLGLLGALVDFLSRAGGYRDTDIGVRFAVPDPILRRIFASVAPLRISTINGSFDEVCARVCDRLKAAQVHGVPALDLPCRYAEVPEWTLPVVVEIVPDLSVPPHLDDGETLLMRVGAAGTVCDWTWDQVAGADLLDRFESYLAALSAGPDAATRPDSVLRGPTVEPGPPVPDLVSAWADHDPAAPAVEYGNQTLTYGELDSRVTALTARLAARGAGPGAPIGVYLPRSPDLVVALLAVLRSGATVAALDPRLSPAQIGDMVDRGRVGLVVTDRCLGTGLRTRTRTDLLLIDHDSDAVSPPGWAVPGAVASLAATADGRPGLVCIRHESLSNLLAALAAVPGCRPGDRVLAVTPIGFHIAAAEIFLPLTTGATVIIAADAELDAPIELARLIERTRPTLVQAVPTTWRRLIASGWCGYRRARVCSGGEPLPADLAEALVDRVAAVWHVYGHSETTVWSTIARIARDRTVTIGTPLANTVCRVLDERLRTVPVGVTGELYIGGLGVADGYHRARARTAARFVADPGGCGERLFRTGDLARMLPDGQIEQLGRADQQFTLHGYRIEPGEIEARLRAHPAVIDAVVVPVTAPGPQLVAYLQPAAGATTPSPDQLRAHLRVALPEYLIPAVFRWIHALPLTAHGAVDRAGLSAHPGVAATASPIGAGRYLGRRTAGERGACTLAAPPGGTAAAVGGTPSTVAKAAGDVVTEAGGVAPAAGETLAAAGPVASAAGAGAAAAGSAVGSGVVGTTPSAGIPLAGGVPSTASGLVSSADGPLESFDGIGAATTGRGPEDDLGVPEDPARDALLDLAVLPQLARTRPRQVLLTGATGFLGAYLLRELLRTTDATVHCLVRAQDPITAGERIRASLQHYRIWEPSFAWRITPVPGDLTAPMLGLDRAGFYTLAGTVDSIYHVGAAVDAALPYHAVRAANVDGTRELLRLAAHGSPTPFHYISSATVFPAPKDRIVPDEDTTTGPVGALATGYAQSKWVAEQLVLQAGRHGLPVAVLRPPRLFGDQHTGACRTDDLLWRVVQGCVRAGAVPGDVRAGYDVLPVDYAATAIVALTATPGTHEGPVYHLTGAERLPFASVAAALTDVGYRLESLPLPVWLERIRADPANPAAPIAEEFRDRMTGSDRVLDDTRTRTTLYHSGLTPPPVTPQRLAASIAYLIANGRLPVPLAV